MADITNKLERVLTRLRSLTEEQSHLLQSSSGIDLAKLERLQRNLEAAQAEQKRLIAELQIEHRAATDEYAAYGNLAGQRPIREKILDILNEIKVPAQPRTVSEVASAIFGYVLPSARFASLRRDEERAFHKDSASRPAWIVPAINVHGLTAMPRLVASSAWPSESRLIGSRTLRTNHLRVLLALLGAMDRFELAGESRPLTLLLRLLLNYASSVPQATDSHGDADLGRIRRAAETELTYLESQDLEERRSAAEALEKLPETFRLWGKPGIVDGGLERGAGAL